MYTIAATSFIMNYEPRILAQKFSTIGGNLKKLLPGIYLHSGRTDGSGGHKDNKNKSGLGSYHYHHGISAHLHPNGVCPYGSKKGFIINPYTGKKISLGQPYLLPYYDENSPNIEYYSLNLVSKALTAQDGVGVELGLNNKGGLFYACATGDSLMSKLGEEFTFSYPTFLKIRQDNTFFETNKGNLPLLCHTKKAALDDTPCYAYISLENVRSYMTKDGYFTDFSDNGSGVWNFTVRKSIVKNVKITSSNNSVPPFNVGDALTVEADIDNAANVKLIIGKHTEVKDNLLNQNNVKFSDYIVTNEDTGVLTVKVEVNTGGTAIDAKTVAAAVQIPIELTTSFNGVSMIANFEMSLEVLKNWGLGEFNDQGELVGIYPHYVFKKNDAGVYISDGGITFGYGHWVSELEYNTDSSAKALVDTYAPNAPLLPTYIPDNGKTYKVPGSSYISVATANELFKINLKSAEISVNSFLDSHNIQLNQNQFDVLVSFTHQHGEGWWTLTPEKLLPKFIREGNGVYDPDDVMEVFLMHEYQDRRVIEAQVFTNGYQGVPYE